MSAGSKSGLSGRMRGHQQYNILTLRLSDEYLGLAQLRLLLGQDLDALAGRHEDLLAAVAITAAPLGVRQRRQDPETRQKAMELGPVYCGGNVYEVGQVRLAQRESV